MMNSLVKPPIRPDELRLLNEFIVEAFGLALDKNSEGLLTK
jgi:hypothetical protein